MESKFKLPTETVTLPSKGLLYPETSALSSGKVEMKYMTAREEDILTSASLIKQGIVLDKLLKSLIVKYLNNCAIGKIARAFNQFDKSFLPA